MGLLNTTYPMHLNKGTINGEPAPSDFMEVAELAREIADRIGRHDGIARTLIEAINAGLPVVIETGGNREFRRITALVDYAVISDEHQSRIRVRYWGLGHEMWLSDITSVTTPDIEYT